MMNPLFTKFQNGQNFPQNRPNIVEQFNEFASTFRGNPKDKVDELLASGRMTRQQYDQLCQMARVLQGMLGKR